MIEEALRRHYNQALWLKVKVEQFVDDMKETLTLFDRLTANEETGQGERKPGGVGS